MIDISKYNGREESHRSFLFRALSIVNHVDGGSDSDTTSEDHNELRQSVAKSVDESTPNHYRGNCSRSSRYTRVTRIAQIDTWDCGIACLLMIASWLRDGHSHNKNNRFGGENFCEDPCDISYGLKSVGSQNSVERNMILSDLGTESIWTSDLLLHLQSWKTKRTVVTTPNVLQRTFSKFSATPDYLFPTIDGSENGAFVFVLASQQVMGADESYRELEYYQNAFEEDQFRVARTFRDLHSQAVPMLQTTVFRDGHRGGKGMPLSTVIEIVERDDCLAIVLLDNNCLLQRTTVNTAENKASNSSIPCHGPAPPYAGHYVILCGTSDHSSHIEIANSWQTRMRNENRNSSSEGNIENQRKKRSFCFVLCNPDPSSTPSGANYMFVTPELFEASWRAQGTDEDIIFLRKPQKPGYLQRPRLFGSFPLYGEIGERNNGNENEGEEVNGLSYGYAHRISARIQAFFEKIIFR